MTTHEVKSHSDSNVAKYGQPRMSMSYRDSNDEPFTHVMKIGTPHASDKILRTLAWASRKGITVTFTPL